MKYFLFYLFANSYVYGCLLYAQGGRNDSDSVQAFSLYEAITIGIEQGIEIRAEKLAPPAVAAAIRTATLRPNIEFNAQLLQLTNQNLLFPGRNYLSTANQQLWYQFTKELQLHKRPLKIATAQAGYLKAIAEYQVFETDYALGIAEAWINTWAAKKTIELYRYEKSDIDSVIQQHILRTKSVLSTTENLRKQQLSGFYQLQLQSAKANYEIARARLSYLLGQPATARPDDSIPINLVIINTENYANRADLQLSKANINEKTAILKYEKANAFPNIVVGVISNPQNNIPYNGLFVTVPLPIFDRNQGNIAQAAIETEKAAFALQALEAKIKTEIKIAQQEYILAKTNLAILASNAKLALIDFEATQPRI
jgi:cobalt-zinc-cadmium efflux system outer membrane protein